ncbi:hypothetical protein [Vibrio diazotrophicus]|uniref:hypothetical protein n=1 Tax=Vibrio diazotrophicus TaxID=685 RepID=UPI000C9EBE1F|nr:hypothetical protein [Vibrio diazotrophicus]PNH81344.1 hypothetical protein C1N27_07310 [Vibrio diazotrophicus]
MNSTNCFTYEQLKAMTSKEFADYNVKRLKIIYNNMCNRVKNHPSYKDVQVCSRWLESFDNFMNDVGFSSKFDPFALQNSISRLNDLGDYCLDNVEFTTQEENKSSGYWLINNFATGEQFFTRNLSEFCREHDISYNILHRASKQRNFMSADNVYKVVQMKPLHNKVEA